MKSNRRILLSLAGLLALSPLLRAQDNDNYEDPPMAFGGFSNQGSAEVGYRFTEVKGYAPMYQELVNLQSGPRLLDLNLFGEAREGVNPFADSYSFSLSGLGGDPFPTAQFSVSKKKLFDLRVNWRQAYFNSNQNDNVILPITTVAAGLSTGLTSNHNWDTVRKFGSVDLTLHATNNLRFNFNYYHTTDDGPTFTTTSPDFLGSPSYWGTYARANPFYLYAPVNDDTNRFTGGLDYTFHTWTVHYSAGYQTFNANTNVNNVTSPELSIDPVSAHDHAHQRVVHRRKAPEASRMARQLSFLSLSGAGQLRSVFQRNRSRQHWGPDALRRQPERARHSHGAGPYR
jgi:hypothetical protein